MPKTANKCPEASRLISLSGVCQQAKDLISVLLEVIVEFVWVVIECVNDIGDQCVVFLDPLAVLEGWSTLTVVTDAMGHPGDSFLHYVCSQDLRIGRHPPQSIQETAIHEELFTEILYKTGC